MKTTRAAFVAAVLWLAAVPANAQEQEAIEPDRPDVTNGTHIVDTGLLQIEIGGILTNGQPGLRAWGSPVTARLGLTEWVELRFGTDGIVGQTDGQRITAALVPSLHEAAAQAENATLDDLGGCALRSDIASLRHETQYTRLFRS